MTTEKHTAIESESGAILRVPLKKIFIDLNWNARVPKETMGLDAKTQAGSAESVAADTSNEGGATTDQIADSMAESRQMTPVHVERLDPQKSADKKPLDKGFEFRLLAGFKRCTAIKKLADRSIAAKPPVLHPMTGDPFFSAENPDVRVSVEEGLTETSKLFLNIGENTGRAGLSMPDLCAALYRIAETHKKETGKDIVVHHLSQRLGIDGGYVHVLLKDIAYKIMPHNPQIIDAWRKGTGKPLSKALMAEVGKVDPHRQQDEYNKLLLQAAGGKAKNGGEEGADPVERLCKKAYEVGFLFGVAEDNALIQGASSIDWSEKTLKLFKVKFFKDIDAESAALIEKAASDGVIDGMKATKQAEAEESAEKAEKVRKKQDAQRAKGNAGAAVAAAAVGGVAQN